MTQLSNTKSAISYTPKFGRYLMSTALTAATLVAYSGQAIADNSWGNLSETQGSFTTDTTDPNVTNITLNTDRAIGTGNADIYAGDTVNVTGQLFAVRDDRADPTRILGKLNSTGKIIIIDGNGVFFGKNSVVDVAGLIATTGDISNNQIMNNPFGEYTIDNIGNGGIDMRGQITVAEAGLAAFVASTVKNSGVINAKLGKVAFASGETVTLDLYGDQLVEIEVTGANADALLRNTGTIDAEGGLVQMSAAAAKDAVDTIINVDGIVTASSATMEGGKIVLSGGDAGRVRISGDLDVSGEGAGSIEATGETVSVTAGATLSADGGVDGDGGSVKLVADRRVHYRGITSAKGGTNSGDGGSVETTGGLGVNVDDTTAGVDTSATNGAYGVWTINAPDVLISRPDPTGAPAGYGGYSVFDAFFIISSLQSTGLNFVASGANSGDGNIVIDYPGNLILGVYGTLPGAQNGSFGFDAANDVNVYDKLGLYNIGDVSINAGNDVNFVSEDGTSFSGLWFQGFASDFAVEISAGNQINIGEKGQIRILNDGDLSLSAGTAVDVDNGGWVHVASGDAHIDAPTVHLGDALDVSGTISGTATTVNVENTDAKIQDGIDVAAAGATVNVAAGTFEEGDINIYKNLLISGDSKNGTLIDATGYATGFVINSDLGNTNTTIRRLSIENASNAGLMVTDAANLKVLSLNQTGFNNNGYNGVAVYGDSMKELRILNSDFVSNGGANGSSGDGDILAYLYNGDVTLTNVTVEGDTAANTADYGIQIRGSGAPESVTPSGTITMENVSVSGNYRAALMGIQRFSETDISMNDVSLGGQTTAGTDSAGWGSLYLSELGNDAVDIGNTSFGAVNGQYILLGAEPGAPDVDATDAVFEGVVGNAATTAESFAIEDKVAHDMDSTLIEGHVTWKDGELFVTSNTLGIQRGVDVADAGNLIHVDAGTFTENVVINKDGLSILGAQAGTDARTRYGATETILEGYIKTGTIDGLIIDGFEIVNQGTAVAGYGGVGSINLGNNASNVTIKNTIIDGNGHVGHGIVTSSAGASDIRIEKNLFTDNLYGVYVNSNDDNVVIVSNRFDGNKYGVITQDGGANTKVNGNTFIDNIRTAVLAWSANGTPSTIGTMNNNQFRNNAQHVGHWDATGADISIEADTGNKFYVNGAYKLVSDMTTDELFALEDLITHDMDDVTYGHVVFGGSDLFVTSNTLGIQNAINLAEEGATVNVDGSEYTEDLTIDKALKLTGHGTTLNGAGGASLITILADDVNIDPFNFNGGGVTLYGISSDGFDNLIVDGNTFTGFVTANVDVKNGEDIQIFGNTMTGAEKGIAGDAVTDIKIYDNDISGTTVAGMHIANSDGTGYNGAGNDVDIWGNTINADGGIGIWVENSDYASIGYHVTNPFVTPVTAANNITGAYDGIVVAGSENAWIANNDLSDIERYGIRLEYSANGTSILNNVLTDIGDGSYGEAISSYDSNNLLIDGNDISDVTGLGIAVYDISTGDIAITNNTISGATGSYGYGIAIRNAVGTNLIDGNDVDGTDEYGIFALNTQGLSITNNDVDTTGNDAINVTNSAGAVISANNVGTSGSANNIKGDGVFVENADGAVIQSNTITETHSTSNGKGSGIQVVSSDDIVLGGTKAEANTVTNAGWDGVRVIGGDNALIRNNTIESSQRAGLYTESLTGSVIARNIVDGTNMFRGIVVNKGDDVAVRRNTVSNTTMDGIFVKDSSDVRVRENTIYNTGVDGIYVLSSDDVKAVGNTIGVDGTGKNIGDDGIHFSGSVNARIIGNTITKTEGHGVHLNPNDEDYSDDAVVRYNVISKTKGDGVHAYDAYDLRVVDNEISDAKNGIFVNLGSDTIIRRNTITDIRRNGIVIDEDFGENGFDIRKNVISNVGKDGIKVRHFSAGYIAKNDIDLTGDDGIDVRDGDYISIYENSIFGAGFVDDGENADSYGADGIFVKHVGDTEILSPVPFMLPIGLGYGYSYAGADTEITGNTIAFTRDDGIEVIGGNRVHIESNILGHIGYNAYDADGINVEDSAHTVVKYNGIADVLGDGINIDGGAYAGVFGNNILLVGDDGIDVSNIRPYFYDLPSDVLEADIDYPTTGYAISIEDNEIVLAGDDGIDVSNSDSVRIIDNDILFAGVGEDNVYDAVNEVAAEVDSFLSGPPVFGPTTLFSLISDFEDYEPSFSFDWGNGDGISVDNVHRDVLYGPIFLTSGLSPVPYPVFGDWTVLIQGNDVSWTGGDGIDVNNAGTTLIGGHAEGEGNIVYQAGIDWMEINGFDSFRDWVESGPFADEESRRVVWWGEDMSDDLEPYLVADIASVDHDAHDGIRASGVTNFGYFGPVGDVYEGPVEHGYYGYALNIIGNDINTTGDDGISASYSSSALIEGNTIMGAGIGTSEGYDLVMVPREGRDSYGSGDILGADGIFAYNIYGENSFASGSYTEGYEEYALVIDGNTINGTDDDGIEVVSAGRTLITENNISEAGVGGGYLYAGGGIFGSDGIHVRDVYDHTFFGYPYGFSLLDGPVPVTNNGYAVKIINNTVDTTADDGVQVLFSENTLIEGNTISNSGDIFGAGIFGGDGIHVLAFGDYGYEGEGYTRIDIVGNDVTNSLDDGIEVQGTNIDLLVDDNNVEDAGDVGINANKTDNLFFFGRKPRLDDGPRGFNSTITNNTVTDAENIGIYVEGEGHNDVIVSGNTVIDSAVGARFESGKVDISSLSNPNRFINTNPLGLPVGLQFDGSSDQLTIADRTIGATIFSGFANEGSFYVRFENGSILDPVSGDPLLINGLDATFDGFNPPSDGILTQEQLDYLEARIFDADDAFVNGRGQLFVGFVPVTGGIENIEDFFNQFGAFSNNTGNIQVTITSLPFLQQPSGFGFNLNNIEPAAGDEGNDPEDLNNIAPAAGDEEGNEANCWGDAVNNAIGGQASSFSFGQTFNEESINQASGCLAASL